MKVALRGNPDPAHYVNLTARPIARVLEFFVLNPDCQLCMLPVSPGELRRLERSGILSGCLGQPRSHPTNSHQYFNVPFNETGRVWVVFHRDWRCIDPFTKKYRQGFAERDFLSRTDELRRVLSRRGRKSDWPLSYGYNWPAPGAIVVPQLSGDLPPCAPDEMDATGMCLWQDWEKSTGTSDAQAAQEAELSARVAQILWVHDLVNAAASQHPAIAAPSRRRRGLAGGRAGF